jgi:UDP-galactose transporter B1
MPLSKEMKDGTSPQRIRHEVRSRVMTSVDVDTGGDDTLHPDSKFRGAHVESEPGQLEHGAKTDREVVDGSPDQNIKQRDAWRMLWGATGIYVAYLYYGHIQEDVFRFRAADGSKFRFAWFLQVLESLANICVGLVGRYLLGGTAGLPLGPFVTSGASQVFSKAFTSLSLAAGLSFPVCILAKSAKIVPVMLGQLALGGSSYTVRDYSLAAAIVGGTALLSLGESKAKKEKEQHDNTFTGITFIILSLGMDGLTAGLQKRLKRNALLANKIPTPCDFLLYTNVSMAATALTIALVTDDWRQGWAFTVENPAILRMVLQVCLCSAIGQSFIFYIVAHFDPLVCATVTTTRKIMSVVWSITTKGHVLSEQGCVGLLMAVSALMLEIQGKIFLYHRKNQPNEKYRTKTSM